MNQAAAAELKTTLHGLPLPAHRADLLEYAVQQRAEPQLLDALASLSDREFESLDEVVDELLHVQPPREHEPPREPEPESGAPPGGDDYTDARPDDTGHVRDA
jgi:hypothetical protein